MSKNATSFQRMSAASLQDRINFVKRIGAKSDSDRDIDVQKVCKKFAKIFAVSSDRTTKGYNFIHQIGTSAFGLDDETIRSFIEDFPQILSFSERKIIALMRLVQVLDTSEGPVTAEQFKQLLILPLGRSFLSYAILLESGSATTPISVLRTSQNKLKGVNGLDDKSAREIKKSLKSFPTHAIKEARQISQSSSLDGETKFDIILAMAARRKKTNERLYSSYLRYKDERNA